MTGAVVAMCLTGLALILISFFVSDATNGQSESFDLDLLTVNEDYELSEREQSIIRRKIEDVIAKQAKEILLETSESLANMANEKMLALGDYAVAVCDEIEKNHKEVMFLYSMLDDKQKEIMHTVKQVDETVRVTGQLQDRIEEMMAESDHVTSTGGSDRKQDLKSGSGRSRGLESDADRHTDGTDFYSEWDRTQAMHMEELSMEQEIRQSRMEQERDIVPELSDEQMPERENANDEILALYQEGESVIDIAKHLGLGVGEVKLVIDLYQGE